MKAHDTRKAARSLSEIPAAFLERMASLLRDEYPAFLASYDMRPGVGLRVNTLKIAPEVFRQIAPFELAPVPWCAAGFTITGDDVEPGKHPFHAAGLYYLQDPSAMTVAELLDPQPGERVLDLASAPGGKATHIAAKMQGQGLLVANEIHPKRAWELAGNLERWGAANVTITNETPERLAERFEDFFDRVLVDAPCSGEGMMRKGEAARVEWAPELVRGCALRQTSILEQAVRLVRPGGRLAYSTCTFNPEENEGTVARFLDAHPEFALTELTRRPGLSPGRPDWLDAGVGAGPAPAQDAGHPQGDAPTDLRSDLKRAVRLWPHLAPGEGHFIAVMRKHDAEPATATPRPWRPDRLPRPAEAAYRTFCAEHLAAIPAGERLAWIGSYLYTLPTDLPDLTGLRFLHPGRWLGTIMKDRFEPSHALALVLPRESARRTVSLAPHDAALAAYLRGEGFSSTGEAGWVLLCVDGYPLGWGKRVAGILKSHYPRGLRWVYNRAR
jgi:16S rRNA C967 or C1407 C5-methylase (RsmB/RsmF family)/NOL1/NOP2/fmu family ribosome biogenesis protein